MSWYNPLTWAGDAGSKAAESLSDGIIEFVSDMGERIADNPEIILVPVLVSAGVIAGTKGLLAFSDELGRAHGANYAMETIE